MIRKVLRLIGLIRESYVNKIPIDLAISSVMINLGVPVRLGLLPRIVTLPNGDKIIVNDPATLTINIPDHYIRREYMHVEDFIPREKWIVFDVGAYVGVYSLWASKLAVKGFVVAFEPNPYAYRFLLANIMLNNRSNIHAFPYALGEVNSKSTLYIADRNIGASSLIKNHIVKDPGGYRVIGRVEVPMVTLDYFIRKWRDLTSQTLNQINLVKIDVEGYEMNVLRGSINTLSKGLIERFVVEVHLDQVKPDYVVNYLADFGYRSITSIRFGNIKEILYLKLRY